MCIQMTAYIRHLFVRVTFVRIYEYLPTSYVHDHYRSVELPNNHDAHRQQGSVVSPIGQRAYLARVAVAVGSKIKEVLPRREKQ